MKLSRIILSYFLILSYTLGFTQSFIPHSDTLIDGQHLHDIVNTHGHQHNQSHTHTTHSTHSHISHTDHIDEGIYDYLICLFSDLEHGESEILMVHELPSDQNPTHSISSLEPISISHFFLIETVYPTEKATISSKENNIPYHSPFLRSISLRGPPIS